MSKILMPIGDDTEVLDTFYAYYRSPEDGYEAVVAGRGYAENTEVLKEFIRLLNQR